jgi:NADH-quinone oxidoreductase subunit H
VLFFLGEYTHMVTTSFLIAILFFGGWHLPWIAEPGPGGIVVKFIVILAKVIAFILFYMVIRWTLPRFRFDQLMALAWKVLIPLALANLVAIMVIKQLETGWDWLLLPLTSVAILVGVTALTVARPRNIRPRVAVRRAEETREAILW